MDSCGGLLPIVRLIRKGVFPLVQIGIPILLIVFGTIDLGKAVISSEEKEAMGHAAIEQVLSSLLDKEQIKGLIHEFDARKTEEAKFAYWCDKLECDLQCKIYDEEGCVDLSNQEDINAFKNEEVQELLKEGKTWSDMWLTFGQRRYNYDQYFTAVSDFAKENEIHKLVKNI